MSDDVELAVVPAPVEELTTAPESDAIEVSEESHAAKSFSQEELDAAIGKRLAREQRKWERERAVAPIVPTDVPSVDQYETVEAYAEALAEQKAEQLMAKRDQSRHQSELIEAYHDREEDARSKYEDFEQVAYNPNLRITNAMAESIQSSDIGPEVAYYLGSNPKEADRISRLTPLVQAKEIGRIEATLTSNPPVKKTSSAPAPIAPVTARGGNSANYDTTDPRSIKTMSTSEWIAAERARQVKKAESNDKYR